MCTGTNNEHASVHLVMIPVHDTCLVCVCVCVCTLLVQIRQRQNNNVNNELYFLHVDEVSFFFTFMRFHSFLPLFFTGIANRFCRQSINQVGQARFDLTD